MKHTQLSTLAAAVSAAMCGGTVAWAGCADIPGNQATSFLAGPVNPNNGFAEYVEAGGIALELCLDSGNCVADPVHLGNVFSEQIGFGAEAFWWLAEAAITTPTGLDAIGVFATEAAFLTEEPADGDQFPFTRLRLRLDVPVPGVYTVTHPYGEETFTVDAVDAGQEIRTSFDIGFVAGAAGNPAQNQGCVAPWLQWDPAESAPPGGFIGDGATPHTVLGSPTGNNLFTVTAEPLDANDPAIDLDGSGNNTVSTNLFTVVGKLYDGTPATPMTSDRTSYERDATAQNAQVDVFATAAKDATVNLTGGAGLPSGDLPLSSDSADARVSDGTLAMFYRSDVLSDASTIPAVVELNGIDHSNGTDNTRLLRRLTDVVTITMAEYDAGTGMLNVAAESSDANVTPDLAIAEYFGVPLPATIPTATPPATLNITSSHGGTASAQVSVIDTTQPVANDDEDSTLEDNPVYIDVAYNDTDAQGDPHGIDPLSVSIVDQPSNGSAGVDGSGLITAYVVYTPDENFNGSDSLTYIVRNFDGIASNVATVNITVQPVNDPPDAADDTAETFSNTPVTIPVLTNDNDIDGDALTVVGVGSPSGGGGTSFASSSVTYTPNGLVGEATFTYTISDGNLTSTASVTVSVTEQPAVNVPPIANDDSATVNEDSGTTLIPVLANDSDPNGDALSIDSVTQPATGGTVVNNGSSVGFTPAADWFGSTSFTYTIVDTSGSTSLPATVNVTVNPINDNPQANADFATTNSLTPISIDVLGNDSDVEGDALTVVAVSGTSNGGIANFTDNAVTYDPNGSVGVDSFTYTVADGNGGTADAIVTINVTDAAAGFDLDIAGLLVPNRPRVGDTITPRIRVRLETLTPMQQPIPALLIGVRNGQEIYHFITTVIDAPAGGTTTWNFPQYTVTSRGTITWTVSFTDGDPDVDVATATSSPR